MADPKLEDLLSEKDVYDRYGKLLADRELREARKNGEIGWFDLRKGPHYTAEQVMNYLKLKEQLPCQAPGSSAEASERLSASSKSVPTGSDTRPRATTSSIIGMTKKLEERAAKALDCET
jgi:hypothetical protein